MESLETAAPSEVIGKGSAKIIAIHGWMGDHRLFEPTFPLWDRDLVSVAFMDCRGYGRRGDVGGTFTVEEIADDVRAAAHSLGWARYHVIGHSMAGMSAQLLAAEAADEIVSAILVASVPASGAIITEEQRALLRDAIIDPGARKALIDVNTGRTKDDGWLAALRDLSVSGTKGDVLEAYMASWTGTDLSKRVEGTNKPMLALLGELDPGASADRIKTSVGSWFSKLDIVPLPETGHYPMYERPREFVDLVTRAVTHS